MISDLIDIIVQLLYVALFLRVILSWVPINPYNPIVELLITITDPLLKPFQNIVPSYKFGIDLSPIFAFIALSVGRKVLLIIFGI